jgi:outer membrane protein assembly factor BamB
MKQPKILFLIIIALLPLTLVSCISGVTQSAKGWSGTAIHDGIAYVGTLDGRVVSINSSTRNLEWDYSTTPVITSSSGLSCGQTSVTTAIYSKPVVDRDIVYIGTYSGQVLALNMLARSQNLTFPQRGDGEWEWDCPIDNAKSNAIVADLAMSEDALYVASSNGRVYSLDKGSGDENWKREDIPGLAEKLWTSPVIQGNALYVSTYDGHIYALSLETGELLDWSFESEAGFASSPVIYEDTLYVGSFDRHLYAIGIGSNISSMWKFPQENPAGNWFWASPIVNEGIVYAGCLDGRVYAIDAETGKELWQFESQDSRGKPAAIVSPPVLAGDLLIVANEAGNVYVIDPETGEGERIENPENGDKPTINAEIRASFCADEGLAYIRAEDNKLYIVDIENSEVSWNFDLTKKEE